MAITEKDGALLAFLIQETADNELRWKPTANSNEFTTTLRGKYIVTVRRFQKDRLYLENSDGETMLSISEDDTARVEELYELARRQAFKVDEAIDEILGG